MLSSSWTRGGSGSRGQGYHHRQFQARRGRTWGFQNQSQQYEVTAGDNTHLKVVAQLQYTMASSKFGRKLNPVPQPWQRRCDCPRDREAGLHDRFGQRRCQQDCGSESGPRHREEVDQQN